MRTIHGKGGYMLIVFTKCVGSTHMEKVLPFRDTRCIRYRMSGI